MKVNVTEIKRYESDIKFVDIDVISEEERLLSTCHYQIKARYYIRGTKDNISKIRSERFYVGAVLTLSCSDLPVGTEFNVPWHLGVSSWCVLERDKAVGLICFDSSEYTEDEVKLKNMLREWAVKHEIKFGE